MDRLSCFKKTFFCEKKRKFIFFALGAAYFLIHWMSSILGTTETLQSWNLQNLSTQLKHLDSAWYVHIASQGYRHSPLLSDSPLAVYAFFPLWPMILAFMSYFFSISNIQILGAALASSLFITTLILILNAKYTREDFLRPKTFLGLAFFVFSPGSWVFCTNHTESLFLFLSWISLYWSQNSGAKSLVIASVFSGLAALTRNQGIFVAISVAVSLSQREQYSPFSSKWKIFTSFILSGMISGTIFLLWPLYQWSITGNFFVSTATQKNWHIITSFSEYVRNFFWISSSHFPRRLIFYSALIVSLLLLKDKNNKYLGLYLLLSILIWPVQGNSYAQAYRFSSVLFPFWFYMGDFLSHKINGTSSIKKFLAFTIFAAMVSWAFFNSSNYFFPKADNWPY